MAWDDIPVCIFAFYLRIRGGGVFILCLELNLQLTRVVTANRHFISCYRVFPAVVSETFDLHVLILRMMRVEGHH